MNDLQIRELLELLKFTDNLDIPKHVLLARHASEAHDLFMRDIQIFEEYQRFQTGDSFGKCEFIVSFIGLPGKGETATFAGIYRVIGKHLRGEIGFRDLVGDPEFVKKWKHQDFLYDLSRLEQFDFLQLAWDIRWNLPGPAKYQYLKPNLTIEVLRFAGCNSVVEVETTIKEQILEEDNTDEISQASVGYSEGAPYYAKHLCRERRPELVASVKNHARMSNTYFCCVCKADFEKIYGLDYIECHHTVSVSTLDLGAKTKVEDMVLLCANCHRAVHKRKPWLEKHELHKLLIASE